MFEISTRMVNQGENYVGSKAQRKGSVKIRSNYMPTCTTWPSCSKSWVKITQGWFVSFGQQGDVWMLLKITEKVIRKNAFEEKKKNRLNLTLV